MGLFDDLLTPHQPSASRRRLGLFDDLLGLGGEPEGPDEWVTRGIFEVNLRTGERRPKPIPGALPTAQIDVLHPDLPRPDAELDLGAAGRLAGTEAIGTAPRLAGMIGGLSKWLDQPAETPVPQSAGEFARRVLAATPAGLLARGGQKLRDALGVTGAVDTSNEAIDALAEQEREKLRRSASTPAGSVAAEWGSLAAGALADPTNLLGGRALVKGGRALAEAAPTSSLRRFLLQDLAGGAEPAAAGARAAEEIAAPLAPTVAREAAGVAVPARRPLSELSREELLAEAERLRKAATEHPVTGLPNRRAFFEAEAPKPITVSSDIDSLKWVNDNISHEAGDALLRRKAEVAREMGIDLHHFGGDEFAARFDTEEDAEAAMEALQKRLADDPMVFELPGGQRIEVPVGFSHATARDYDSADALLGPVKQRRTAEGLRAARGEPPASLVRTLPERPAAGVEVPRLQEPAREALEAVARDDTPEILGRESVAYLSDGTPVRTRWVLRDADTVETSHTDAFTPNPLYPHATGAQPRDLDRPEVQERILGYERNYNPELIGPSPYISAGAGSFARQTAGRPFMIVGNSRTLAQRRALEDPGKLAGHLEALARQNRDFGFPEDFLDQARAAGMRKPAAFRELVGDFDPAKLGREGNVGTIGALSDAEIAGSDARELRPELLDLVVDGAPIDAAVNRDFVRSFLGTVVPRNELGPLVGPNGELAASGERRIRNALLAAAYRDPDAVSRLIEADAEGIRTVGRGMVSNAARLAKLSALAERGEVYARDIGQDVAQAARKLADLRAKKMPTEMYLRNSELFGAELTPEARRLLEVFDQVKREQSAPAGILRRYAELVESFGDPRQASLMGPVDAPPKLEILEEAIRTWKQSEGPLLFEGGPSALVAGLADALPAPLGAMVRHIDLGKALAVARRWLTNYGDQAALGKIAPDVAEKIRLSVADRAAHEARAAMNLRDYDAALKTFQRELSAGGIQRTQDEIAEEVLSGLLGKSDLAGLSPALQDVAVKMRAHVDELTGGILDNQTLTKELRYTLEQNLGAYLRRTYEIHRDAPGWEKVVKETEPWRWEGAKRWVGEQHPQWADDQIEGYLNSFFQRQPEAATTIAPRSDVFRVEKGLFKHRIRQNLVHIEGEPTRAYPTKEAANRAADDLRGLGKKVTVAEEEGLPKELEDFLGLHVDPRARYSESVARMAHDLSTARLMGEIRQMGEFSIFYPTPTGEFAAEIAGDARFNPLAGMYTTPQVRTVLAAMGRPSEVPAWLKKAYAANAVVRSGKTVGSPLTHVRNFLSWTSMLVANGHFSTMVNVPRLFKAAKVIASPRLAMQGRTMRAVEGMADAIETVGGQKLSNVFRIDLPTLRTEFERAIRLGVIQEGARSQEFARYLGLVAETKTAAKIGETKLGRAVGSGAKFARELYTAEDDVGKMVAWLAERANYQWAFPELSADEIAETTAKLARDLYPTYSKAAPAVRAIRDFPFFGDFPTFWAEMIRTSKNVLKQGATELAQAPTNPRLALVGAKRLAGFGTALAAPVAVAAALRARLGISEEELEAVSTFAPEWNRHSDLVPVEKKGPGQYSMLDVSYINPYALFREAWNALTATGYQWDDRFEMMFEELRAPFSNEGILAGTAIDLARNRTAEGRTIYPEFGTRAEKANAMAKHVVSRLQPGGVSQGQDVYFGVTGEENPRTGRKVDLEKLVYSYLTGTRQLEIDVPKRLGGAARGLQRSRSEITGEFNRLKKRTTGPTPELLEAKAAANAQWKRALADFRKKVADARATGLSDYQIRAALNAVELGDQTINAALGDQDFEVAR